jgi:hypothetical protein
MQGGAPPHIALPVRSWLYSHFTSGWIGRRGPTEKSRYYVLVRFFVSKPRPLYGLNNILEILLPLFLLISWGKVLCLCFPGCNKRCNVCSNVVFCLADIAIHLHSFAFHPSCLYSLLYLAHICSSLFRQYCISPVLRDDFLETIIKVVLRTPFNGIAKGLCCYHVNSVTRRVSGLSFSYFALWRNKW